MTSASEDDVLVHLLYDRFSRLRLSRGLDKPSPKLLGKDKPWLELAVTAYLYHLYGVFGLCTAVKVCNGALKIYQGKEN